MAQKAIRVSLIYMVVSILLGMYIGITHTFNSNLISVHSHMLFIGWIFFTLVGILYFLFPTTGESALAKWAFVIQNIGIVVWMIGVLLEIIDPRFASMAGIGASISTVAIVLFSINIWQGVKLEKVGKSSESNLRL